MLSKRVTNISPSPTLAIGSMAKEMIDKGLDVISMSSGEPDFYTPLHIREAAIAAINEGHTRYTPVRGTLELREAICNKLKRDNNIEYSPDQIVVSNGAKHSLFNTLAALIDPGDEVIIPSPCWVSYPELVSLNHGVPVMPATGIERQYKLSLEDLEKNKTEKTRAIILNSPNNPTGQVYSEQELKVISEFCCENNIYIISDEIYEKLLYTDTGHNSPAAFSDQIKDITITINGLSKSFAMTGWRIGYTASRSELAAAMDAMQSHSTSNPNSIAQKAALAALTSSQDCVEEMRLAFEKRKEYIFNRISRMPLLSALEPAGTFYLFAGIDGTLGKSCRGQVIEGSDDFSRLLLEQRKVAIVPGTGFGAPNSVRLSFATSMDNISEGMDRVEAFINELD